MFGKYSRDPTIKRKTPSCRRGASLVKYEQRLRGLVEELLDRCDQRTDAERLGDVAICASRQTHRLISGRRLCCQHHDWESEPGERNLDVIHEHQARFRHRT